MFLSIGPRLILALWVVVACTAANASREQELRRTAFDVEVGREMADALFKACEPHYRSLGFDPRFFVFFWNAARFDVYEGARITLGAELDLDYVRKLVAEGMPSEPPTFKRCERLVKEDTPQHRIVPGVAEVGLQQMRDVYRSTKPDPHVARDKSLLNDCMKANFNARQLDFDLALRHCDCTLSAMHSMPAAELDDWFDRARSSAGAPMSSEPWFSELLPKLQACRVR
jgi:hypothetical protein